MQEQRWAIECARCGAIKLERVTEAEAKGMTDGTGPIYKPCERCEKTTGWIKAKEQSALAKEKTPNQSF
jgi:hypothetical protein